MPAGPSVAAALFPVSARLRSRRMCAPVSHCGDGPARRLAVALLNRPGSHAGRAGDRAPGAWHDIRSQLRGCRLVICTWAPTPQMRPSRRRRR